MIKREYIAELVGSYALIFCGTGAIIINDVSNGAVSHLGVAIVFGAIVMIVIHTFGKLSGAHINPAVTISLWLTKKVNNKIVVPYIISQLIGATLASATLLLLFPGHDTLGSTVPAGSILQSFILEILLSFFLMFVILNSISNQQSVFAAGVTIGTVVMLEALFAGPITGASMNPARSIGPALISGTTQCLWLYIVAPILGMLLSIPVWKLTLNLASDDNIT